MTLTCPRCFRTIAVFSLVPRHERYEVRTACPGCGCKIVVEVGLPVGVGPKETKGAL